MQRLRWHHQRYHQWACGVHVTKHACRNWWSGAKAIWAWFHICKEFLSFPFLLPSFLAIELGPSGCVLGACCSLSERTAVSYGILALCILELCRVGHVQLLVLDMPACGKAIGTILPDCYRTPNDFGLLHVGHDYLYI